MPKSALLLLLCAGCSSERAPFFACESYVFAPESAREAELKSALAAPGGRVLVRGEGAADLPLIIKTQRYPTQAARDAACTSGRWDGEDWGSGNVVAHFVARNFYFAPKERLDELMRVRRKACASRNDQGAPPGRIYWRAGDAPDLPLLLWENDMPSMAPALRETERKVTASADFSAIAAEMKTKLSRFEGAIYHVARQP